MTVIAWDNNLLVADGRCTMGMDITSDNAVKIRSVEHPTYGELMGAFCGAVLTVEPWIDHIAEEGFNAFELPSDDGDWDATAVLVRADGKAFEVDTTGLYCTVDYPSAYGSGQQIAQHYLRNGSDALTAVREACKSNITCGGHIIAWDWRTRKFHRYAK